MKEKISVYQATIKMKSILSIFATKNLRWTSRTQFFLKNPQLHAKTSKKSPASYVKKQQRPVVSFVDIKHVKIVFIRKENFR
jgi:hypothetical protein